VIQDILKALIKNDYNTSYSKDVYEEEDSKNEIEQVTSKFSY
jgi:hypothetical protein